MTIFDLEKKYYKKIDRLDLELVLEACLKKPRTFILAHPEYKIKNYELRIINNFIRRRIKGEPLAYILGRKEFFGLDFQVNKNVLVPRPETEMMVEEIIKKAPMPANGGMRGPDSHIGTKKAIFIDIGTGSGCIIITLAKILTETDSSSDDPFFGIDISEKALSIAKKNAKFHCVDKKIRFIKGSLLEPILKKKLMIDNCELIIAANLPYVPSSWKKSLKSAETRGLAFEPSQALYSGIDGLDHYRRLALQVGELRAKTKKPITLFCEIGHEQAKDMKKIFSFAKKIEIRQDHDCRDRLVIITI